MVNQKNEPLKGRITLPFKMKNKLGKNQMSFRLKELFGFLPEVIVFMYVQGEAHQFQLFAEFTPEEQAKEILRQKEELINKEGQTHKSEAKPTP